MQTHYFCVVNLSIELRYTSSSEWLNLVLSDFDNFLIDHANCERKASAMAMGLIAKYPNRKEIIPELIETAIEELEHFRDVYALMEKRGIGLPDAMEKDTYITDLVDACRNGRDQRFMDRMLLASVIECRGAERFKLIYEALEDKDLKQFYHMLWASEAKHGNIFVKLLFNYFDEKDIYKRLHQLVDIEADVMKNLPLKAALH